MDQKGEIKASTESRSLKTLLNSCLGNLAQSFRSAKNKEKVTSQPVSSIAPAKHKMIESDDENKTIGKSNSSLFHSLNPLDVTKGISTVMLNHVNTPKVETVNCVNPVSRRSSVEDSVQKSTPKTLKSDRPSQSSRPSACLNNKGPYCGYEIDKPRATKLCY